MTKVEDHTMDITKAELRGQIQGLALAQTRFMGIGYDQDNTAREIRSYTYETIDRIYNMLDEVAKAEDNQKKVADAIKAKRQ